MIDIKNNILLIVLFIFCFLTAKSQVPYSLDTISTKEIKKMGNNAMYSGDIYSAIDYFSHYYQRVPEDYESLYQLAELCRLSRDYEHAEYYYKVCYDADGEKYVLGLFYHALMQKMNGEYYDAETNFNRFLDKLSQIKKIDNRKFYKTLSEIETQGCQMADSIINTPLKVIISHLDTTINHAHIDFSPRYLDDNTMIYGSYNSNNIEYFEVNDTIQFPPRKFYKAKKHNDTWQGIGQWQDAPFNNPDFHVGNGAFSYDSNRFYFTRCRQEIGKAVTCAIYESVKVNGKWLEPKKLPKPINLKKYTSTQPTIGYDAEKEKEYLYFVSDRPEGYGKLDIWYAAYNSKDSTFGEPKNVGKTINTVGIEMTPFYNPNTSTLFFSSTGHPGIGGLDIFRSYGNKKKWTKPKNFGYPINSSADDIYFVLHKNAEDGFFVSNRFGGMALKNPTCCDDIYTFKLTDYFYIVLTGKLFRIEYIENILDLNMNKQLNIDSLQNKAYIDSAIVKLFEIKENPPKKILIDIDTTSKNGEYYFEVEHDKNYKLEVKKSNYFFKQFYFTTKKITSDTLAHQIGLNAISKQPIVIKNIYYPFDKSYLTEKATQTIDTTLLEILKQNPELIVEISSHTDSKGTDEYNVGLSQRRAQSVVDYLIKNGIDKKRLQAKGYGEKQPIAPNKHLDGSDNPEGRAKNRRTEFRVIGTLDEYSGIIYKE